MYISLLRQIANTLLINIQYYNGIGLLKGRQGVVLFLYHFSRYMKNDLYSSFSNNLLDIEELLNKNISMDFIQGLSGIGWSIDYLIKNDFVDADADVLSDIDEVVGAMSTNDFLKEMKLDIPIFSKGLYFLQRDLPDSICRTLLQCDELLRTDSAKLSLAYANSILYVVNKVMLTQKGLADLCRSILAKLYVAIETKICKEEISLLDLYLLNRNIKNMPACDERFDWISLQKECETPSLLEVSWIHFIYRYDDNITTEINETEIREIINGIWSSNPEELSLYNGLAGIGLELLRKSM